MDFTPMDDGLSDITYRPYEPGDIPFIYSSWSKSYYIGCRIHRNISPKDFHDLHRPKIDQFFTKPKATIIICYHTDEPTIIIGWVAVEILDSKLVIHYAYVKKDFRRRGFCTAMIERIDQDKPIIITHMTDRVHKIFADRNKYEKFEYLPIT